MTLFISIGRWGGVYLIKSSGSIRFCFGWMAATFVPMDDEFLLDLLDDKRGDRHV